MTQECVLLLDTLKLHWRDSVQLRDCPAVWNITDRKRDPMYVFKDTAGVREEFKAQQVRAEVNANRIKLLINQYATRASQRADVKAKIETDIRSEGGITYLRERLYGFRHEVSTWELAIELLDGVNPPLWEATHPDEAGYNPSHQALKGLTCISPVHDHNEPCVLIDCHTCQTTCDPKYWVTAGETVSLNEALVYDDSDHPVTNEQLRARGTR
jgi:hypothetical protein